MLNTNNSQFRVHFQNLAKILAPEYDRPGTWFALHVGALMLSVTEFQALFSQHSKTQRQFPALRFELIDFPWEPSFFVPRDDHTNFEALKRTIFNSFTSCIASNQHQNEFRIVVTPPEIRPKQPQALPTPPQQRGQNDAANYALLPLPQVVVRIQIVRHGGVSRPYPKTVLKRRTWSSASGFRSRQVIELPS